MRVAIHQPNFIPWFCFFEKMAQCDLFILLVDCQYEKNGFTNRCQVNGKWWTKPIRHGMTAILDKYYADGQNLVDVNLGWIVAIAKTLGVNPAKIRFEPPPQTDAKSTARLIEILKFYEADEYLADHKAPERYLDLKALEENGIKFVPFKSNHRKSVFEMFNEFGIEKTTNILNAGVKKSEIQEAGKKDEEGSQAGSTQKHGAPA